MTTTQRHPIPWIGGLLCIVVVLSLLWPLPPSASHQESRPSIAVTASDRTLLREATPQGRSRAVPVDTLPQSVVDALIATEDQRFYLHPGIDPIALVRALWSNWRQNRIVSGGSTLSMQVARLLRGDPSRTIANKIVEMHLALRLELRLSKREILSLWLNRVSFGNRAHGVEAAAQLYFRKSARDLTRAQAAYLIGLPRSPSRYNPFRHPERAERRQHHVLRAMASAGFLTEAQRKRLARLPVTPTRPDPVFRAPHLTRRLLQTRIPSLDASVTEVRTTVDPTLQNTVADLVQGHVQLFEKETLTNAAAVVLDNRTGAIRAYVGSADFWDDHNGGQNDGVRMLRQPGSTLKPFTYARALGSRRYTPASVLADTKVNLPEVGGAFTPENYDETFHGPTPLRQALASSFNVPAVRIARAFGPTALLETLHEFGFSSLDREPSHYGVGLTLGNGEVKLIELARAYAALSQGGSLPPVHAMQWARTVDGDTVYARVPAPRSTGTSPGVAHLITDILDDPAARAPGFGRGGPLALPFPAAVKTGTSKDYRDNWTVGYTPRHTVAVWAGNFDGSPMDAMSGVAGAAPLFHSIMRAVGPGGSFDEPPSLQSAQICPASGKRPGHACPAPHREQFLPGTIPTDTCDVHRLVHVDQRTGRRAAPGADPAHVEARLYTVYPERYHDWMREQEMLFPPPPSASEPDSSAEPTTDPRVAERLRIQYPADGSRFYVDPVLRREHQRVHLRGSAPDGVEGVSWVIDGERLASGPEEQTWTLQPGRHRISLRGRHNGRIVRSTPVRVRVVAAERPSARATARRRSP